MNAMGCSMLILAAAILFVGFIPILAWTTLFVALPLALMGTVGAGISARRPGAQPADKAMFWIAVVLTVAVILRITALSFP